MCNRQVPYTELWKPDVNKKTAMYKAGSSRAQRLLIRRVAPPSRSLRSSRRSRGWCEGLRSRNRRPSYTGGSSGRCPPSPNSWQARLDQSMRHSEPTSEHMRAIDGVRFDSLPK
jgi:hypothetical protein